jgi:methylated-DNA-[protein]-cysteine S-methyltransferase
MALPSLTRLNAKPTDAMNPTTAWLHCRTDSPLGPLLLARTGTGLCGAWFAQDQKHLPAPERFGPQGLRPNDPLLQAAAQQLSAYFTGQRQAFDLPLDLSAGTAFQQAVWHALLDIPHGQISHYGTLAKQLGRPSASRAVGTAVGRNPLSIIVPCHRVLGSTGALTGYAGGLRRKQALLQLENHTLL